MTPKEECEVLMNELLPVAEMFLKKNGEFFPFGCVMKNDGTIEQVAFYDGDELPKSEEVIRNLTDTFQQWAKERKIKASGIAWDAKVFCPDNTKSDAVVMSLEHLDDYSATVASPYKITLFKRVKWKPLFASQGEKKIFK